MDSYWYKRQRELLELSIEEAESKLSIVYSTALKDIFNLLVKAYADITENDAPLISKLYRYNRYYKLIAQLQSVLSNLGVEEEKIFTESMKELYVKNSEIFTAKLNILPIDEVMVSNVLYQDWIGDGMNFSDRIWSNKAVMTKKAKDLLMSAVIEGKPTSAFINDLQPFILKGGIYQAKRLLRTEMAHIQYISALNRYKDAGLVEVEIKTAEDDRVCESCKEKAGVYDINEAPILPMHPNCRCCILPVI